MGINYIPAADLIRFCLLPFELAEIPLTIANVVDATVKQPILKTAAKITQLIPIAVFAAAFFRWIGPSYYSALWPSFRSLGRERVGYLAC